MSAGTARSGLGRKIELTEKEMKHGNRKAYLIAAVLARIGATSSSGRLRREAEALSEVRGRFRFSKVLR